MKTLLVQPHFCPLEVVHLSVFPFLMRSEYLANKFGTKEIFSGIINKKLNINWSDDIC